ncbi:Serine hydrolase [Schizosaccharomyces pombe]|uniref:Uncharacterized hydrolase C22A12.06c n=1 Tax=Schizosaccharomyces pombe (strain 972 / ATCC 24843) TaxID=284812 RepID=YF36_SCHPO|nr:serine hydrolase-like protein [Schizosaccharomyces pombe]O13897.1 RecName: Full=Uncharacterized hydrolase C22A12.06c [Schizosaccharomyces pombe 972h-]CAB16576.1 serine hydrolase-like [Schizosaccharomyces pombe]|eukprot:NP_593236.1 serine hydrolase-like protein [Schizosaccharomyces pombe]
MKSATKSKILCIHGYAESGELFSVKLRALRERMADSVDFYFPTGPIELDKAKDELNGSGFDALSTVFSSSPASHRRGWWRINEYADTKQLEPTKAFEYLASYIKEHGPFDGILGFSQGTNLAANLAALVTIPKYQEYFSQPPFRFALFFSGYFRPLLMDGAVHATKLDLPTLHLLGKYDTVLSTETSTTLVRACKDAQVLFHPAAHQIPAPHAYVEPAADFIDFFSREDWPIISKHISLIVPTKKVNTTSAQTSLNNVEHDLISKIMSRSFKGGINVVVSDLQMFNEYKRIFGPKVLSLVVTDGQEPDTYSENVHYTPNFKGALAYLEAYQNSIGRIYVIGDKKLLTLGMLCRCTKRIIAITDAEDKFISQSSAQQVSGSLPFLEHSKEWLKAKSSQIRQWTGQSRLKHMSQDNSGEPVTMKLQMWERL